MPDFFLRHVAFAALLAFGPTTGVYSQDEERPIWEQEAMLIYSESSSEFSRLRSLGHNNKRLATYTHALDVLFQKEPVLEGEEPYRVAQALFRVLVTDLEDDAIGLASQYYLARIAQSNPIEQDMAKAKLLYEKLYQAHPDRFFGQMAFIKYATLEIYDEAGSNFSADVRLEAIEPLGESLTIPEIRRSFHRILGQAYIDLELREEKAYEHLSKAYEMGIPVESIRFEVLEQLAALGEQLGETERAMEAYEQLRVLNPRHERAKHFEQRAKALRSQLGKVKVSG